MEAFTTSVEYSKPSDWVRKLRWRWWTEESWFYSSTITWSTGSNAAKEAGQVISDPKKRCTNICQVTLLCQHFQLSFGVLPEIQISVNCSGIMKKKHYKYKGVVGLWCVRIKCLTLLLICMTVSSSGMSRKCWKILINIQTKCQN